MILSRRIALAGLAALAIATPAFAHHGWSWTESGFFQLEGIVTDFYFGNPHPTLDVDVEGAIWRVELAPPAASTAAGLTGDSIVVGDEITAIGNRSQDANETRMKAVRVIVKGQTYDVYPDRAKDI
jgi:hydrogenase/urease accessory protein HupE